MTQDFHTTVKEVAQAVIDENPDQVRQWMVGEAGTWGFLAGKAVAQCRQRVGRRLSEGERRLVWELLWRHLGRLKGAQGIAAGEVPGS